MKMPSPGIPIAWGGALAWFGAIAICSFLITWVVTDLLKVGRSVYVGLLALLTGGLTYGYLTWSKTDAVGFLLNHWAWGLLGAALTAGINLAVIRLMIRRGRLHTPPGVRLQGRSRDAQVLWEDVIYGASEGMLLSVLPLLALWQAFDSLGWTTGWAGKLGAGALALAGSLVVIGVHHLGYREYRSRRMAEPYIGCVWFSLAYLLTGSPLAAMVGHMGTHAAMISHGFELPPHQEAGVSARALRVHRMA
jgi:hypothetical protein